MSWYLANEDGIIGQFASGKGLSDLTSTLAAYPALAKLFKDGATKNIVLCSVELNRLAKTTCDMSVRTTATTLANLLRGQRLVSITQGVG